MGRVDVIGVGVCSVEVSGVSVAGVAGFGGIIGVIEGGGIRVTGVLIGARLTEGNAIGFRLPEGGGMRVTGVDIKRGCTGNGTGKCGVLFGTGGIGADCVDAETFEIGSFDGDVVGIGEGVGTVLIGGLGIVVTGVIGFVTVAPVGAGEGVEGVEAVAAAVRAGPKRLAARMY